MVSLPFHRASMDERQIEHVTTDVLEWNEEAAVRDLKSKALIARGAVANEILLKFACIAVDGQITRSVDGVTLRDVK